MQCIQSQRGVARFIMDGLVTERAISSLGVAFVHFVIGFGLTLVTGRYLKKFSNTEWLIVFWLFYDAVVHFTLVSYLVDIVNIIHFCLFYFLQEGPFVYFSLTSTVVDSSGILANVCKCNS